ESVGMKLLSMEENYGWAELGGSDGGAMLGIAQQSDFEPIRAGQNAIVTLSVDNLESACADLIKRGVKARGEAMEVPGVVKLQMMVDPDGNHFQIVETLDH